MSPIGPILLFALCAFLCFKPGGADPVRCAHCMAVRPGGRCVYGDCEISSEGTCVALSIYKDGQLAEKILGCKRKADVVCGSTRDLPDKGLHYELRCCETNFCNADF